MKRTPDDLYHKVLLLLYWGSHGVGTAPRREGVTGAETSLRTAIGHLTRVGVQVRPVPQAAQQLGGRQQTAGPLGAGQAGPDLDQCPVQYSGKLLPAQFVQGLGGLEEGQLIFPLQSGGQGAGGLLQSVLLLTALQQRRGPAQDALALQSGPANLLRRSPGKCLGQPLLRLSRGDGASSRVSHRERTVGSRAEPFSARRKKTA